MAKHKTTIDQEWEEAEQEMEALREEDMQEQFQSTEEDPPFDAGEEGDLPILDENGSLEQVEGPGDLKPAESMDYYMRNTSDEEAQFNEVSVTLSDMVNIPNISSEESKQEFSELDEKRQRVIELLNAKKKEFDEIKKDKNTVNDNNFDLNDVKDVPAESSYTIKEFLSIIAPDMDIRINGNKAEFYIEDSGVYDAVPVDDLKSGSFSLSSIPDVYIDKFKDNSEKDEDASIALTFLMQGRNVKFKGMSTKEIKSLFEPAIEDKEEAQIAENDVEYDKNAIAEAKQNIDRAKQNIENANENVDKIKKNIHEAVEALDEVHKENPDTPAEELKDAILNQEQGTIIETEELERLERERRRNEEERQKAPEGSIKLTILDRIKYSIEWLISDIAYALKERANNSEDLVAGLKKNPRNAKKEVEKFLQREGKTERDRLFKDLRGIAAMRLQLRNDLQKNILKGDKVAVKTELKQNLKSGLGTLIFGKERKDPVKSDVPKEYLERSNEIMNAIKETEQQYLDKLKLLIESYDRSIESLKMARSSYSMLAHDTNKKKAIKAHTMEQHFEYALKTAYSDLGAALNDFKEAKESYEKKFGTDEHTEGFGEDKAEYYGKAAKDYRDSHEEEFLI